MRDSTLACNLGNDGLLEICQALVDSNNYFFGAIFNLADAYISVATIYLLLFQYKFFSK